MIRFFVRQPVLVNMLMLGVVVAGAIFYRANIKEQMPEVRINAAWIATLYPGVAPADMEPLITRPIEDAVRTVEGIDYVSSDSTEGRSFIWVEFRQDIPSMTKAVLDLQNRVNQVTDLPADAEKPRVGQAKVRMPAMSITISGGRQPERVLREVGRTLQDRLEDLRDVGQVFVSGIRDRQVDVVLAPQRLRAHGISVAEVVNALRSRRRDVPGGNVVLGRSEYALRALVELRSLADIERIVVRPDPRGRHVTLGDLATVRLALADPSTAARVDGTPGVVLTVLKEYGGDLLRLSSEVTELLGDFRRQTPDGVEIKLLGNGAREVERGLRTLYSNGLIGMVLVLICLWLFLGGRNAAMASLGLPVAMLGAALAMYLMGITVNVVALFALILCVGIVVDDAIVIIENIYRHLEQGSPPLQAAVDGTREVMWPVISSVLTTCAAFLPLLLMTGIMGEFFSIIPKVVVAALAASLFEALVVLPSHMADLGPVRPATRLQRLRDRAGKLVAIYRRLLLRCLRRPLLVSLTALTLCGILVGTAFATKEVVLLADEDIQLFDARIQMPRGTTLARTMEVIRQIERRALQLPRTEVAGVVSQGGWSRTRLWPQSGKHLGMVSVFLVPTAERARRGVDVMNELRRRIADVAGPVRVEVTPVTFSPPKGMPVAVRISGEHFPKLKRLADTVKHELRRIDGAVSIADDFELGKRELRVRVQPQRAALHGLRHSDIGQFIRVAYGGFPATVLRDRDEELDVVVRYPAAVRNDPDHLAAIELDTPAGARVALGDVARVEPGQGLSVIRHRDRKRTITVTADVVAGRTTSAAVNQALQRRLGAAMRANPEVRFAFGGEWEKTAESLESLFRAFAVAALLIFTILAAQFRSLAQPAAVLLAIPLSLIGVVTGFFVSGEPVGMIALVGVVGLAGIAVNDATVLIDFVNTRHRQGRPLHDALVEACTLRLRPVLLTTVTTIAGLFPLAMGWGGNSESLRPMALAIVWGLSFCTVLTLLVIPCLYVCITWASRRLVPQAVRRAFNRHGPPPAGAS